MQPTMKQKNTHVGQRIDGIRAIVIQITTNEQSTSWNANRARHPILAPMLLHYTAIRMLQIAYTNCISLIANGFS